MKYLIISSTILALLSSCDNSIENKLREASASTERGEFNKAEKLYDEVLAVDKNNAEAHSGKGDCLGQQGDLYGSIRCYKESLKYKPINKKRILYNLAITYEETRQYDLVISTYESAVKSDPKNLITPSNDQVYINAGIFQGQQGYLDEAIAIFKKALKYNPRNADVFHNIGYAYRLKDDCVNAIKNFKDALKFDPDREASKEYIRLCEYQLDAMEYSESDY